MKRFFKLFRKNKCRAIRFGRRGRYTYAMPLDSAGIYELYQGRDKAA